MAKINTFEMLTTMHIDLQISHKQQLIGAAKQAMSELESRKVFQNQSHNRTVDAISQVTEFAKAVHYADERSADRMANAMEQICGTLDSQIQADKEINTKLLDLVNYGISTATMIDAAERFEQFSDRMRAQAAEDSARANRWRSVESELPPDGEYVLVRVDGGEILLGMWKQEQGCWYRSTGSFPRYISSVTHWAYQPNAC